MSPNPGQESVTSALPLAPSGGGTVETVSENAPSVKRELPLSFF